MPSMTAAQSMAVVGVSRLVREIGGHLEELYGIEVSPDLISAITDAVLDEVAEWQSRPLDICYPLVFFDAIRVKVRDEASCAIRRSTSRWVCCRTAPRDSRDLDRTDRGRQILAARRERIEDPWGPGHSDRRVDGLKGFPEAINAVFPQTIVQTCIVHLIRHSMDFASWKDRKGLAQALRTVYRAPDAATGQELPSRILRKVRGGRKVSGHRTELAPQLGARNSVLCFPRRRAAADDYTTNAIEALNSKLCCAVRTRQHFPSS